MESVYKALVEFKYRLCRTLERFAVLVESLVLYVLRHIVELGIKSCDCGVLLFADCTKKIIH